MFLYLHLSLSGCILKFVYQNFEKIALEGNLSHLNPCPKEYLQVFASLIKGYYKTNKY